jgi:hypothetical protein
MIMQRVNKNVQMMTDLEPLTEKGRGMFQNFPDFSFTNIWKPIS